MVKFSILKGLYEIEKTIGCGGFAKVKLATHVTTGEKVAIKIMDKAILGDDLPRIKLEIKALKTFCHEHICKLYQVFETETHFLLVMEYCSGGELFDHIVEKNRLSETESRTFFRQIVSAVAYLHSLGYAHRDLKPENVLLDKNHDLKLIDFGLCAKPNGGMESHLFTSCGSPTYAAPELVMGQKYLGPEVDVWAMGVLLYALLAGYLPFDDVNIDSLYKKILAGKYEEPAFISRESKKLIKSMLQVDPKKRVLVEDLLSHNWMTLGIMEPVDYRPTDFKQYDSECVKVMSKYYRLASEVLWSHLKKWKYDYYSATYLILMAKKKKGLSLKLNGASIGINKINAESVTPVRRKPVLKPLNINQISNKIEKDPASPSVITPTTLKCPEVCITPDTEKLPNSTLISSFDVDSPRAREVEFLQPKRPSTIRKPLKRIRSPTLDGDGSPVPTKKATPAQSTTPSTPERKRHASNPDTPGSARGVLNSIERSLNKVRHVLTPKKSVENSSQPSVLTSKGLSNVSTTQYKDPEFVINRLVEALRKKGINCNRKGFRLLGKMEADPTSRFMKGCSFELEICYLPALGSHHNAKNGSPSKSNGKKLTDMPPVGHSDQSDEIDSTLSRSFVGIRRKRLKGDSWCYKKVCEQVLALTSNELRVSESAV